MTSGQTKPKDVVCWNKGMETLFKTRGQYYVIQNPPYAKPVNGLEAARWLVLHGHGHKLPDDLIQYKKRVQE